MARLHIRLAAALLLLSAIPAVAQVIVFESTRDGNFEIYSINADGSGIANLSNHPALDRQPDWSPDGSKIAFTSARDGNGEIYVMNADGSGLVNLTNTPADGDAFPRWSPGETRIAYNSSRTGGEQIAVMNADGSNPLTKTNEQGLLSDTRWSPNGAFIAYAANRAGKPSIIVMDTVNFDPKDNLTHDLDSAGDPQWSPDGLRIAFTSGAPPPTGSRDIYAMNANGSGKVNLTNNPADDEAPLWSPDGSRILFLSNRDGDDDIYTMNADGSSVRNLTSNTAVEGFAQWSPDGSRIVFSSNRDSAELELYRMNADGSNPTRLTTSAGNDFNPQPSGNFSFGQPPAIFANGVILANLVPKVATISPLSIVSIFGRDFSSETLYFPNLDGGKIHTILGRTCVEIGGERAPIFAVTPTQANVQTPATPTTGPVSVVIIRDCGTPLAVRSNVEMVTIEEATPGFFIFDPIASGFIAARFNATGSQAPVPVAPANSFPNDSFGPSRPAQPGDIILLYGTGWGPAETALTTGQLAPAAAPVRVAANPMVTLGGIPLAPGDVLYVGVTPNTAGLFQLAIRIPEGTTPGNKQVVLTVYGKSTPLGPVIPIAAP